MFARNIPPVELCSLGLVPYDSPKGVGVFCERGTPLRNETADTEALINEFGSWARYLRLRPHTPQPFETSGGAYVYI